MSTPVLTEPTVVVEGGALVIRITLDTLCHAVTMGQNWPVHGDGRSAATITDRPLFAQELIRELTKDNEQGATPLHLLFDEMAGQVIEWGGESIELHEDDDQ